MEGTGRDFPDKGNGEPKPGKQGRLQEEGGGDEFSGVMHVFITLTLGKVSQVYTYINSSLSMCEVYCSSIIPQ